MLLADGSTVLADLVVVGVGVRPNTLWLEGSKIVLRDGVLCDAACRGIVAAGDVARWEHPALGSIRMEHCDNAIGQGPAAARALLEPELAFPFSPMPYVWADQNGARFQLVGRPDPDDELIIAWGSFEERRMLALYGRDGQLTAGLAFGAPRMLRPLRELVAARAPLARAHALLREHGDAPARRSGADRREPSAA